MCSTLDGENTIKMESQWVGKENNFKYGGYASFTGYIWQKTWSWWVSQVNTRGENT